LFISETIIFYVFQDTKSNTPVSFVGLSRISTFLQRQRKCFYGLTIESMEIPDCEEIRIFLKQVPKISWTSKF